MNQIEKALEELAKAIKNSEEFEHYQKAKEQLHCFPKLEQQVMDYRRKTYELQNSQDTAGLYEEVDRFKKDYKEFRKNPYVSEYLAAELALCRIVQQINWTLIEGLDFEVGFEE